MEWNLLTRGGRLLFLSPSQVSDLCLQIMRKLCQKHRRKIDYQREKIKSNSFPVHIAFVIDVTIWKYAKITQSSNLPVPVTAPPLQRIHRLTSRQCILLQTNELSMLAFTSSSTSMSVACSTPAPLGRLFRPQYWQGPALLVLDPAVCIGKRRSVD